MYESGYVSWHISFLFLLQGTVVLTWFEGMPWKFMCWTLSSVCCSVRPWWKFASLELHVRWLDQQIIVLWRTNTGFASSESRLSEQEQDWPLPSLSFPVSPWDFSSHVLVLWWRVHQPPEFWAQNISLWSSSLGIYSSRTRAVQQE